MDPNNEPIRDFLYSQIEIIKEALAYLPDEDSKIITAAGEQMPDVLNKVVQLRLAHKMMIGVKMLADDLLFNYPRLQISALPPNEDTAAGAEILKAVRTITAFSFACSVLLSGDDDEAAIAQLLKDVVFHIKNNPQSAEDLILKKIKFDAEQDGQTL